MAATPSSHRYTDDAATVRTPILRNSGGSSDESNSTCRFSLRLGLCQLARFLRQASRQRMMREEPVRERFIPEGSMLEILEEQFEEREMDWAYSKPVVVLDTLWNFAFIVTTAMVLVMSVNETLCLPLTVWVIVHALQCVIHVVCVCIEFKKRRRNRREEPNTAEAAQNGVYGSEDLRMPQLDEEGKTSTAKRLETVNTLFSFIWWIVGYFLVSPGGQDISQDSPLLYWLCVVFLGIDVFFIIFCIVLATFISIAVCCCSPCLIALLYAVKDQDGAREKDIDHLPKFTFRRTVNDEKLAGNMEGPGCGIMTECGADLPIEYDLCDKEGACCICLLEYEDGSELRKLPCSHHFHCTCVDKWLKVNATCPLCKYDILNSTEEV